MAGIVHLKKKKDHVMVRMHKENVHELEEIEAGPAAGSRQTNARKRSGIQ